MTLFDDLASPSGEWVYLDHAASTPVAPDLIAVLPEILRHCYANPSATHRFGYRLCLRIERLASHLLTAAGIAETTARVIWTSGGTEANNLAISGVLAQAPGNVVTSAAEHASVANCCRAISRDVRTIPIKANGQLDLDAFARALDADTRLVTVCLVQNETGVIQDLPALRKLLDERAPRALLHTDAVQAFAKLPLPWQDARLDLLSLSGHKVHGPGGTGALIIRQGIELAPLFHGGGQQQGLRSGSLDATGIHALVHAASSTAACRERALPEVRALQQLARDQLGLLTNRQGKPLNPLIITPATASPYILSLSLPGYQGAVLARHLGERGVIVGTGSACASESRQPSHTLTAMGLSREQAFGALRVSFSRFTTAAEIETFARHLQQAIHDY